MKVDLWGNKISEKRTKQCDTCFEWKPFSEFGKAHGAVHKDSSSNCRNKCKSCKKKDDNIVRLFKKTIPLPPEDYKCPGCSLTREELNLRSKFDNQKNWCYEHDHETGKFRGFLCNECNNALARARDESRILRNLADYRDNPEQFLPNYGVKL